MQFKLFLLFICSTFYIYAQTPVYYVDSVKGNDSNSGTIDAPFRSLPKGISVLGSNGTVYVRAGTYPMGSKQTLSKNGSAANYIKIWAYQNEKVIVDFTPSSSTDGFSISGSYYYLKGLDIKSAKHNGINISGNNNIIENCITRENGNTGLHLTSNTAPGPSNNLILNCDSYYNFDSPSGGNADGFSAKWTVGPGNVFKKCRSWNNSDDGWDLWMCTGIITIDSCYAFRNGVDIWHTGKVNGNGNGFKLGGSYVAAPTTVKNCIAFDNAGNGGKGFDENHNMAGQTIYNCTSFRNKGGNFSFPDTGITGQHHIKNCISFQGTTSIINAVLEKNSWQGFNISSADFLSIDTAGVTSERNPDGTLPKSNFFRLAGTSSLIDAGVDVGLPYNGKAPDLGAFETQGAAGIKYNNSPSEFSLNQNYPNPFNPSTKIIYSIEKSEIGYGSHVQLKIFDILGQEIKTLVNEFKPSGKYNAEFDASNLSAGIYYARMIIGTNMKEIKMVLVK
jgi:hypothetical protein